MALVGVVSFISIGVREPPPIPKVLCLFVYARGQYKMFTVIVDFHRHCLPLPFAVHTDTNTIL